MVAGLSRRLLEKDQRCKEKTAPPITRTAPQIRSVQHGRGIGYQARHWIKAIRAVKVMQDLKCPGVSAGSRGCQSKYCA
jgi:hypothetical protein